VWVWPWGSFGIIELDTRTCVNVWSKRRRMGFREPGGGRNEALRGAVDMPYGGTPGRLRGLL
jgi:hypothetical protein